MRFWSDDQVRALVANPESSPVRIAKMIGKTPAAVYSKARELGVKVGERFERPDVFNDLDALLARCKPTENGCMVWAGAKNYLGYGIIARHIDGQRKLFCAHRVAWSLNKRTPIPPKMMICHTCDNPPCCNPDHLFLGTAKENNADKTRKGRNRVPHGEAHYKASMSERVARLALSEMRSGKRVCDVARKYKISLEAASLLNRGKTWLSLQEEFNGTIERKT